jgi:hypothetical protein
MRPAVNPTPGGQYTTSQSLRAGDIAFARMEKVNAELVAITYGCLVSQLFKDKDGDPVQVTRELEKMGYNMGIRMVDEFLAKNGSMNCQTFSDSVDVLVRIAFRMFLGIDAEYVEESKSVFIVTFIENPLNDFVELPTSLKASELRYSNLYCGIIRGAFEQLHMNVKCEFVKDVLRGDDVNSIRLELVGIIRPESDDE